MSPFDSVHGRALADVDAHVARDRRHRRGRVAGDHAQLDALASEETRPSRAHPGAAPPTGRPGRAARARPAGRRSRSSAPVAVPNATTRRPCACSRGSDLRQRRRAGNRSGAPSTYEVSPSRSATPAPRRRERHVLARHLRGSAARRPRSPRACGCAPASSTRTARPRAAPRPGRRRSRPRPRRRADPAAVSVPVLSRQITSTDASDSIAFSCCASAPRRASCSAAAAKVRLASRISPSGTSVTMPATAVVTASWIAMSRCQSE